MTWFSLVTALIVGFAVGRRTGYNAGARWAAVEMSRRIVAGVNQRLGD